jgi:hypothetical protein
LQVILIPCSFYSSGQALSSGDETLWLQHDPDETGYVRWGGSNEVGLPASKGCVILKQLCTGDIERRLDAWMLLRPASRPSPEPCVALAPRMMPPLLGRGSPT